MTNETFDKDKVLGRIRKLMAMADPNSGATEGERDNAMRMAHATLAKYNLSMSQVESSGAKVDEKRGMGSMTLAYDQPWVRTACLAVAHLMFCEYFYVRTAQGGKNVKHFFVGRETNVKSAQELATYVVNSIDREARRMEQARTGRSAGSTYWRSFCKGATARVYHRCEALRKEAEAESAKDAKQLTNKGPGTALVLASVYEQERKANLAIIEQQVGPLQEKATRQRNTDWDAHSDGRAYGDKVNLTPVQTGNTRRLK